MPLLIKSKYNINSIHTLMKKYIFIEINNSIFYSLKHKYELS